MLDPGHVTLRMVSHVLTQLLLVHVNLPVGHFQFPSQVMTGVGEFLVISLKSLSLL